MHGHASAYAALGLEPDADLTDIDRAYKKLIKLHHPDREGGNSDRAAEINRAYRELCGRPDPREALVLTDNAASDGGRGWVKAAMVLVIALAALLVGTGPVKLLIGRLGQHEQIAAGLSGAAASTSDPMDQPIHRAAVTEAIRDAVRIAARHDDAALLDASRECHRVLRSHPAVLQLDRCAAFDDAVVEIQNHDPMWDRGPFSQIDVTGRQWSAASALSNDYLAVDGRLDRVRLQVELALAQPDTPTPPADTPAPPADTPAPPADTPAPPAG
jgi:DnaJ-like protein